LFLASKKDSLHLSWVQAFLLSADSKQKRRMKNHAPV